MMEMSPVREVSEMLPSPAPNPPVLTPVAMMAALAITAILPPTDDTFFRSIAPALSSVMSAPAEIRMLATAVFARILPLAESTAFAATILEEPVIELPAPVDFRKTVSPGAETREFTVSVFVREERLTVPFPGMNEEVEE